MRGLLICTVVVMLVSTLISCGGVGVNSYSLDGIQLSAGGSSEAVFVAKENDSSDEKAEQTQAISFALNNAIKDRPDLALMLEADIVDDENNFLFMGSDHFLKTLQSFADENYPKAKKMFLEMTCEEFYYCTAVGYEVANSNNVKTTSVDVYIDTEHKNIDINPSFEDIINHGFWATYFARIHDLLINDIGVISEDIVLDNSLDMESHGISFDSTADIIQLSIINLSMDCLIHNTIQNFPELKKDGRGLVNQLMTHKMLDHLQLYGFEKKLFTSYRSRFSEIGTQTHYMLLLIKINTNPGEKQLRIGDIFAANGEYLFQLSKGYGMHKSDAEGINESIMGMFIGGNDVVKLGHRWDKWFRDEYPNPNDNKLYKGLLQNLSLKIP